MNLKAILIEKYRNNKELSKSFVWRLIQILTKQGTSALMFFIATHFLSKEDMGIYGYISSILLMLVIFSDFGISVSASRYIALYYNTEKEKVKRVFYNSFLIVFVASVLVASVVFLLKDSLFPKHFEYILYALPLVFLYPLTSLLDGIYRGLKKFKKLALVSIPTSVVGVILSLTLVTSYGLKGAILVQVFFFLIYSLLLLLLHREYQFKFEKKIVRDIGKYSLYFGIASLGYYFFSKVNVLILGGYDLFKEIAVYELLNKVYVLFLIPFTVLGQVLAPNIVEIFSKKMYRDIRKIFRKMLLYMMVVNIFFVPLSILLARFGIGLLFPIYADSTLTSLLLPVALTYMVAVPVVVINAGIITSTGHANLMAIQNVISGILNVLLNIWVVGRYGYIGVVWVTFGIQIISTLILYIVYYSKLSKPIC